MVAPYHSITKLNGLNCCGIMRYLRANGTLYITVYKDPGFLQFQMVLDWEMKQLQSAEIGRVHLKAEPITYDEEEILWQKSFLVTTQQRLCWAQWFTWTDCIFHWEEELSIAIYGMNLFKYSSLKFLPIWNIQKMYLKIILVDQKEGNCSTRLFQIYRIQIDAL